MKKNLLALFSAAAVAFAASNAIAAPTPVRSGIAIPATAAGCIVLGDQVTLNLSKGVEAAYNCDETRNAINVGACHVAGSRSATLTCAQTGFNNATPPVATFNNAACNAENVGSTITVTSPSFRGYRASSVGGSVAAQSLSGNCADNTPESELVTFQ